MENQNEMVRFTKALLLEKMSKERQRWRELRHRMLTLVVLTKRFLALVSISWFEVIGALLGQRFIFQSSWFNVIGRVTVFATEFVLLSTCSSSSTWQAITYAFDCFPPQCIFLFFSNRTVLKCVFPRVMRK